MGSYLDHLNILYVISDIGVSNVSKIQNEKKKMSS